MTINYNINMFDIKRKYVYLYLILTIFLVMALIIGAFFDLQISKSWSKLNVYGFNLFFDYLGMTLIIYILILLLFIIFNKKMSKANTNIVLREVYYYSMLFLVTCIYLIYVYYFCKVFNNTNNKIKYISISSISFYLFLIIFSIYRYFILKLNEIEVDWNKIGAFIIYVVVITLITSINKILFGRIRPINCIGRIDENNLYMHLFQFNFSSNRGYSFNSGHTTSACCILGFSLWLKNDWKSILIKIGMWIIIICVALSRIFYLRHYFTDVLFSIILAIFVYYLINYILYKIEKKKNG